MLGLYNGIEAIAPFRNNPVLSQSMLAQLYCWDIGVQHVDYERVDGAGISGEETAFDRSSILSQ